MKITSFITGAAVTIATLLFYEGKKGMLGLIFGSFVGPMKLLYELVYNPINNLALIGVLLGISLGIGLLIDIAKKYIKVL